MGWSPLNTQKRFLLISALRRRIFGSSKVGPIEISLAARMTNHLSLRLIKRSHMVPWLTGMTSTTAREVIKSTMIRRTVTTTTTVIMMNYIGDHEYDESFHSRFYLLPPSYSHTTT